MHEMHRERMRKKLNDSGESLENHELLELLLYYALPRVNTNDVAHELIATFGSIGGVFEADTQMLVQVKGVGEKTAVFLKTIGLIMKRCGKSVELPKIFSFEQIREPIKKMFSHLKDEVFVAFFLDLKQRIIGKKIICDHSPYKVSIDLTEFSKQVISLKPTFVVIAHNHLSGNSEPTESDDKATEKLCMLLKLHNVNLVDHLVVTSDDVYSYYYNDRIDEIKRIVDSKI